MTLTAPASPAFFSLEPRHFLAELEKTFPDIARLTDTLHASERQLQELAATTEFSDSLQFKMTLGVIHLKLLGLSAARAAVETLTGLLKCDKPEVARRSATALLGLAGLPASAKTTFQPRARPPVPGDPLKALAHIDALYPLTNEQAARLSQINLRDTQAVTAILTADQKYLWYDAATTGCLPDLPECAETPELTPNATPPTDPAAPNPAAPQRAPAYVT